MNPAGFRFKIYRKTPCARCSRTRRSGTTQGVIKDLDQLKLLYQIFAETLERLVAIGSARGGDP